MGGGRKITEKTGSGKRLPVFKSDEEAEAFLEQDLSDYITAENIAPFRYVFLPGPNEDDQSKPSTGRRKRTRR